MNKTVARWVMIVLLVVFVIIDLRFNREMLYDSSIISMKIQKWNLDALWWFVSYPCVFWFVVVLVVFIVHNNYVVYMMFIFTSYLFQIVVVSILKAVYYRGRPFVVNTEVRGCICDPGMPSGHVVVSVATYHLLYVILDDFYMRYSAKKTVLRLATALGCIMMTGVIIFSRMAMGEHSYNQLIMAVLISGNIQLQFTYIRYVRIILFVKGRFKKWCWIAFSFFFVFTLSMIYVNSSFREQRDFWVFGEKCDQCKKSFVIGQTKNLAICFLLASFYLFIPVRIRTVNFDPELDTPCLLQLNSMERDLHIRLNKKCKRMMVFIAVLLPGLVVFIIYEVLKKIYFDDDSAASQAYIVFFVLSSIAFYSGFAVAGLRLHLYNKMDMLINNDYIDLDRLYGFSVMKMRADNEDEDLDPFDGYDIYPYTEIEMRELKEDDRMKDSFFRFKGERNI